MVERRGQDGKGSVGEDSRQRSASPLLLLRGRAVAVTRGTSTSSRTRGWTVVGGGIGSPSRAHAHAIAQGRRGPSLGRRSGVTKRGREPENAAAVERALKRATDARGLDAERERGVSRVARTRRG